MAKSINVTRVTKPYSVPKRHQKTLNTLTPSRPVSMTDIPSGLTTIAPYPVRKGALDERYTPQYPGDVYGQKVAKQKQGNKTVAPKQGVKVVS